jgi:1,6-anhydro-N-acetylmuramate kinase
MPDATVTLASPRSHKHHQRYAQFSRLNHSKQLLEWLDVQAARQTMTAAQIFAALDSYTAEQIEALAPNSL